MDLIGRNGLLERLHGAIRLNAHEETGFFEKQHFGSDMEINSPKILLIRVTSGVTNCFIED